MFGNILTGLGLNRKSNLNTETDVASVNTDISQSDSIASSQSDSIASSQSDSNDDNQSQSSTINDSLKLLSLTPVYKQKTDKIVVTSLFMALDQGHDFHDGGSRTKCNGLSSWVDKDVNGTTFFNKIKKDEFRRLGTNEQTSITLDGNSLFSDKEFICGLINTTLSGKKNVVGITVIDDDELTKVSNGSFEQLLQDKLNETILYSLTFDTNNVYYCLNSKTSGGSDGLPLVINIDENTSVTCKFLPFHVRNYNDGMHSLWSFNKIKHIFVITLDSLTLNLNPEAITASTFENPTHNAQLLTTIDYIIPQYTMDFDYLISKQFKDQKNKDQNLINEACINILFDPKNTFNQSSEGSLVVSENIGSKVCRGARYKFYNVQKNAKTGYYFREFLKYLYGSQIPYIHDNYMFPTVYGSENSLKTEINNGIAENDQVLKTINYEILDSKPNKLYKQYGFITDTNIGSEKTQSTAINIIGSLNYNPATEENEDMLGGASSKFTFVRRPVVGEEEEPEEGQKPAFDTTENIIETFNTNLDIDTTSNYVDVNVKSTAGDFVQLHNEYSNMLQMYYELVPTTNLNNNIYYFNNSWLNKIFYEKPEEISSARTTVESPFSSQPELGEEAEGRESVSSQLSMGGSKSSSSSVPTDNTVIDYPFKFSVVSGVIDSSMLGGQNIPQYQPPEIDIYMFIYDPLTSLLTGAIVRMSFLKYVNSNCVNSKSSITVLCHFVYVDFSYVDQDTNGIDFNNLNYENYPVAINKLLQYAIESTEYINNDDEYVNDFNSLNDLKNDVELMTKLNEKSNFKLNTKDGNSVNWYKYFTNTSGPTVKLSIVAPSNADKYDDFIKQVKNDYVAAGIVSAANKIYENDARLQSIFSNLNEDKSGQLNFLKLFLIRNKYTGDKSRSTDTLFLNKTPQLSGVQISNDENTLYNAQMFGLGTVWCTSAKTIFYMEPYYTYTGNFILSNIRNKDELQSALKNNPDLECSQLSKKVGANDSTEISCSELIDEVFGADFPTIPANIDTDKEILTPINDITLQYGNFITFLEAFKVILSDDKEQAIYESKEVCKNNECNKRITEVNKIITNTLNKMIKDFDSLNGTGSYNITSNIDFFNEINQVKNTIQNYNKTIDNYSNFTGKNPKLFEPISKMIKLFNDKDIQNKLIDYIKTNIPDDYEVIINNDATFINNDFYNGLNEIALMYLNICENLIENYDVINENLQSELSSFLKKSILEGKGSTNLNKNFSDCLKYLKNSKSHVSEYENLKNKFNELINRLEQLRNPQPQRQQQQQIIQPSEQPTSVEIPEEQPTSVEIPEEQPTSVEIPEEQPTSVEIPEEQPTSVEIPEEQPTSVEIPEEQPTSAVEIPEEQPTTAVTERRPLEIYGTEEQPQIKRQRIPETSSIPETSVKRPFEETEEETGEKRQKTEEEQIGGSVNFYTKSYEDNILYTLKHYCEIINDNINSVEYQTINTSNYTNKEIEYNEDEYNEDEKEGNQMFINNIKSINNLTNLAILILKLKIENIFYYDTVINNETKLINYVNSINVNEINNVNKLLEATNNYNTIFESHMDINYLLKDDYNEYRENEFIVDIIYNNVNTDILNKLDTNIFNLKIIINKLLQNIDEYPSVPKFGEVTRVEMEDNNNLYDSNDEWATSQEEEQYEEEENPEQYGEFEKFSKGGVLCKTKKNSKHKKHYKTKNNKVNKLNKRKTIKKINNKKYRKQTKNSKK